MHKQYSIYKGLQKPLVYRGFKGKFIAWGIASLVTGLVSGGLIGSLTNMVIGGFITIVTIAGGLVFTFYRQKEGLHNKTRANKIYIHPVHLQRNYAYSAKDCI